MHCSEALATASNDCHSNRSRRFQWPFSSFGLFSARPICSLWPFSDRLSDRCKQQTTDMACTIPPTAPNVDHSRKPNPPVQMRNDIWRSTLSLLCWRLLPFLLPPLCVAAVENTGENDHHNEADETSDEERAKSGTIRHLWRALPADCLPVSTCAALVTSWGGGRAPWKEQQPAPSNSMEGLYGSRTGREQRSPASHRQPAKHSTLH